MGTEKTILHRHTCNPIFTAELFTVARTWRQPKYLSTEEWIKRMWYIHTTEYYSVRKKWDAICSNMDEPRCVMPMNLRLRKTAQEQSNALHIHRISP